MHAQDDDEMNETALKVMAKSGPWALLTSVFVGFYLLKLDPAIDALTTQHTSMRAEIAEQRSEESAESKALLNVMGQILMSTERTAYLQRVQCQNEADTPAELRACAKDKD